MSTFFSDNKWTTRTNSLMDFFSKVFIEEITSIILSFITPFTALVADSRYEDVLDMIISIEGIVRNIGYYKPLIFLLEEDEYFLGQKYQLMGVSVSLQVGGPPGSQDHDRQIRCIADYNCEQLKDYMIVIREDKKVIYTRQYHQILLIQNNDNGQKLLFDPILRIGPCDPNTYADSLVQRILPYSDGNILWIINNHPIFGEMIAGVRLNTLS